MTTKQTLFCTEYLIDLNATQAAIRAGYSTKTAYSIGAELLNKPEIRSHIDKAMAERSKRTGISAERVLRELARVAFLNPTDVVDVNSATLKSNVSSEDTSAISSVKVKIVDGDFSSVEREIRFADKLKALELLGKHLNMFTDNINLTGDVGVEIINDIPKDKN